MGLDLTGHNGSEGRISVWARGTLAEAVDHYYEGGPFEVPVLWWNGYDMDQTDCNKIADALQKAVDTGWFVSTSEVESWDSVFARWAMRSGDDGKSITRKIHGTAERLVIFLRNCGGGFTSVG